MPLCVATLLILTLHKYEEANNLFYEDHIAHTLRHLQLSVIQVIDKGNAIVP